MDMKTEKQQKGSLVNEASLYGVKVVRTDGDSGKERAGQKRN